MKQSLTNQRGQMTIEMVLITVVLVSIMVMFTKGAQASGYAAALVEAPWGHIQGMIEDGVWKAPKDAVAQHPSILWRHHSVRVDSTVVDGSADP